MMTTTCLILLRASSRSLDGGLDGLTGADGSGPSGELGVIGTPLTPGLVAGGLAAAPRSDRGVVQAQASSRIMAISSLESVAILNIEPPDRIRSVQDNPTGLDKYDGAVKQL